MFILGGVRRIDFRIVDITSVPVTGLELSDFDVVFLRNNQACQDALTLTELGSGLYSVAYTPASVGHDYLEIYHESSDIRTIDSEDVVSPDTLFASSAVFTLTHDFGGANALKVAFPGPDSYMLYVYDSADWQQGNRDDSFAVGITSVDVNGKWTSAVTVYAGTYHIIAKKYRETQIIRAYLKVPQE